MIRRLDTGAPPNDLSTEADTALEELLLAAYAPTELSPTRHARLIHAVVDDPFAPASPEELRDAEALRLALDGRGTHPDLILATALASAWSPGAPKAAMATVRPLVHRSAPARWTKEQVRRIAFGLGAASLAVAAAAALVLQGGTLRDGGHSTARLYQARSTTSLFRDDFKRGESSRRIDRIAAVRGRELRENRFALWGVP